MTILVVETGVGVTGANTYADGAHAARFHGERDSFAAWQQMIEEIPINGLLIDATRMLDRTYAWLGVIATTTQGLALPRMLITTPDGRQINGAAQVALAADAVSLLALRLGQDRPYGGRKVRSESLPDYSVTYADDGTVQYPEVDHILSAIVDVGGFGGGPQNVRMVRWS